MGTQRQQMIQKHWSYPQGLLDILEWKASRLGYRLSDYVRYLLTKEAERELRSMPVLDDETIEAVGEALEDYRVGRVTRLDSDRAIDHHFDRLTRK